MDYNIQALKGLKSLVLVTLDQSKSVAEVDAPSLSTRIQKYVQENTLSYFVVLNTWGHQIIANSSEEAWVYIWMHIQRVGLVPVIRDTSALADKIIHGEAPEWDYVYGYLSVFARRDYAIPDGSLADLLSILRYPKRFSPEYADRIRSESLEAFLQLNKEQKVWNVTQFPWFWVQRLKARLADMFSGYSYDITDGYFSSGTTSITPALLLPKLKAYAESQPNLGCCMLYPVSKAVYAPACWRNTNKLRDAVKVEAVPKSFKAARIIAKEPPFSAFALQAIAKGLYRSMERNGYCKFVDIHDQTYNQDLSEEGSISGKYATIDLSSASDSICESLAYDIIPLDIMKDVDEYRCAYLSVGKERRVSQIFSTSGSPITFVMESAIFCAIALEVGLMVHNVTGIRCLSPRIYGDDMVVDDRICETVVDVLSVLGFRPNASKTFFGKSPLGYYRESCGEEWLNGMPMHTLYYPRNPIAANANGIAALCELQHKFFPNWKLRMFLSSVVLALEPRMTAHPYGEPCDDLWDVVPTGKPHQLRGADGEAGSRRKYLCLMTKYQGNQLNADDSDLLEMWYYYNYLKYGPLYEDPISELLRVSISRRRTVADSCRGESVWRLRVE